MKIAESMQIMQKHGIMCNNGIIKIMRIVRNHEIKEIMKIMAVDLRVVSEEKRIRPENSEVERLVCNNEKLLKGSSWKPEYGLKQGLSETINWFKENIQTYKAELYHI